MRCCTRRDMLRLSALGAISRVAAAGTKASEDSLGPRSVVSAGEPPVKSRMFWTWDHSTEWALNRRGAQTFGSSNLTGRGTESFVKDYTHLLRWCGHHGIDAVVVWGLLRDCHGGLESAKRLCDVAAEHGVRLLCGVGLNAYGGVYYQGDSPYSLVRHLEAHPELVGVGKDIHEPCAYQPGLAYACPSRPENQDFAAESLRWLFKNLPLGGVQVETGDYEVCHCGLCEKRRHHPSSTFSWEDMALMYPLAAEAIRSVSSKAWIVCETYSHPGTYTGSKEAPGWGGGKPAWADDCLKRFPKGEGVFVQWALDNFLEPKPKEPWPKTATVSNADYRNVMRASLSTYWLGFRGELAIDWIADMVQHGIDQGFDAISLFGEVSPFNTCAELNYLALANYGGAPNPKADLDVFLRDVAGPLLGGEKNSHDYLRYARFIDDRSSISDALKEIYARCASLPRSVAQRWVWLGNYLASFVYDPDSPVRE